MSDPGAFAPRSPLEGAMPSSGLLTSSAALVSAAGVEAVVRDGLGLATILERRRSTDGLPQRVRERFGLELPTGPRRSAASGTAFVGTGPGAWLAIGERGGNEFAATLMRDLDGVASVADQSDGYVLIRLSGDRVRDALAKLIPINVHPRAFAVGDAASTVAALIGVTLWRLADESNAPVFEVVLFRSLARSFWHALAGAGAQYGVAARIS